MWRNKTSKVIYTSVSNKLQAYTNELNSEMKDKFDFFDVVYGGDLKAGIQIVHHWDASQTLAVGYLDSGHVR